MPDVAVTNDGTVIQVFRSDAGDDLEYRVGRIKPNYAIGWHGCGTFDSNGQLPSVAVNEDGYVLVLHQQDGEIAYDAGWLTQDGTDIDWTVSAWVKTGTPLARLQGKQPSVFVRDDGLVIAAYACDGYVRCLTGTVRWDGRITWSEAEGCDLGDRPAIAFGKDLAVQTHRGDFGFSPLCASTSRILDRSRWMEQLPGLMDKTLGQVTLPGSDKSGGYAMTTTPTGCQALPGALPNQFAVPFALTQEESVLRQLQGGIRYFDLRPYFADGRFVAWNEFEGVEVKDVFDDIKAFMQTVERELVVLYIKDFCPDGVSFPHHQLTKLIRGSLTPYLVTAEPDRYLTDRTLGTLLAEGPRVIVVYDASSLPPTELWPMNAPGEYHPSDVIPFGHEGIWRPAALGIYDAYTKTSDPSTMLTDQLDRLRCFYGDVPSCNEIDPFGPDPSYDRLFLLSWTLTPDHDLVPCVVSGTDCDEQLAGPPKNQHELAMAANRHLGRFIRLFGDQYRPHVLSADYFADARVTDLALELNGAFCAGDTNSDGDVNFVDVVTLLGHWGETGFDSPYDLDCSGTVGFDDLLVILGAWGSC